MVGTAELRLVPPTHDDQERGGPTATGASSTSSTASAQNKQHALSNLLSDATGILLTMRDLSATMTALARRAAGTLGDGISITVLAPNQRDAVCVVAAHEDPAVAELLRQAAALHSDGVGLSAEARRRRQVLVGSPDPAKTAPRRYPLLRKAGVRRAASVPLRAAGGSSGNLVVYATREETALDPPCIETATILGERLSEMISQYELLSAAEQQAANLEALFRSSQGVMRQHDLDAIFGAIADEIERIIPADLTVIFTTEPEQEVLQPRIQRSRQPLVGSVPRVMPLGRGLVSSVIETGRPVYYPEAHRQPRSLYSAAMRPFVERHGESVLLAPLTAGEEVVGVLFISRFRVDAFSPAEFKLFQLFAGQAASALQRAAVLDEERRRRLQAETLAGLSGALARARAAADVVPLLAEAVRALYDPPREDRAARDRQPIDIWSALYAPDGSSAGVAVMSGLPFDLVRDEQVAVELEQWLIDATSGGGGGAARRIEDLSVLPPSLSAALQARELRAGVVVPLRTGDTPLGAIVVWGGSPRSLAALDLTALDAVAGQGAAAVARLQADRALAEQLRANAALVRAAEIAFTSQTEAEALSRFADLLPEAAAACVAGIWLLDADDDERTLHAACIAAGDLDLSGNLWPLASADDPTPHVLRTIGEGGLPESLRGWCVRHGAAALVLAPIVSPDGPLGLACLLYRDPAELPDDAGLALIEEITRQMGIGLSTLRLREDRRLLYRSSVEALAATVDARDPFTHTHSRNVAHYSRLIAERLGLPRQQVEQIELAGLLHDIGKIGLADQILTKTGPLDPDERIVMMTHPARGADILAGHEDLAALVPIVRHHHERYDGFGYPDGLAGGEIPLGAAIVSVADAFDSMVSDRSSARRRPVDAALDRLRLDSGRQFHPEVVAALVAAVGEDATVVRRMQPDDTVALMARRQTGQLPAAEVTQIRVLSRIARELGALTDLSTFLARAREIVAAELRYDQVEIILRAPELAAVAASGPRPGMTAELSQSAASWVADLAITSGKIARLDDLAFNGAAAMPFAAPALTSGVDAMTAVPLITDGEVLGAICVGQPRAAGSSSTSQADAELLTVAAEQLAAAVRVAQLHDEVKWAARHDGLTEALNRRAFYQELAKALAGYRESGRVASVLLCDVEGLKRINDEHGHPAGDQFLKLLVARIRAMLRPGDVVGRYGGDEFAVIAYDANRAQAEAIAYRLRVSLRETPLLPEAHVIQATFGAAEIGADGESASELIACADARLYAARGRRSR